eukprot:TRINITY_DN12183_c0_g1_i1.p1 TRINITY_DN12183_c0_g1~~TRINITY_DN12183_c0_g1_i1.p1  ORF type:complete len:498 (+),score=152.17 TRINITY_DN12183_c0_g1_i1:87-1580(+)
MVAPDEVPCAPPVDAEEPAKMAQGGRKNRAKHRGGSMLREGDPEMDSLAMCYFTCPRAAALSCGLSPRHKRISRVARRRQQQMALAENSARVQSPEGEQPATQVPEDTDGIPSETFATPVEAPVSRRRSSFAGSRSATPSEPHSIPSPLSPRCAKEAEGGKHGKGPRERPQRIGDSSRARTCFGDELIDIDHCMQLFLLDKEMNSVRLMIADRHERKVLQELARAYKLSHRCCGNGERRVFQLMKTKSSGQAVDAAGLRAFLGRENALSEPAELYRTSSGPSDYPVAEDVPLEHAAVRTPPSVYRAASRMTRAQQMEQAPDPHVFELYYQRYADGCPANMLLQSAKIRHDAMIGHCGDDAARQNATAAPCETMYERLMRAEAWLALQRQSKRQIAARRRAVAECGGRSGSAASSNGLSGGGSGHCTPTPSSALPDTPPTASLMSSCEATPAHEDLDAAPPPSLDLGLSLSMGLTGKLDGLCRAHPEAEGLSYASECA